jgi:dUTP pyrophosphatase
MLRHHLEHGPLIRVKLTHPNAKIPTKAHETGDSCFDLYATGLTRIYVGQTQIVDTGVIMEIPEGWGGWIWGRSGLAAKWSVTTRGGVIDSNYRLPIGVILKNDGEEPLTINAGDRIAQIDFRPIYDVSFVLVEETNETSRKGGFGSSGK